MSMIVENTANITVEGKTFTHIRRKRVNAAVKLYFSDGNNLICTYDHRIKLASGDFELAQNLNVGDKFSTGVQLIEKTHFEYSGYVYDLLNVEGGNEYTTHGVISHNCEFLSSDALLISSMKLAQLRDSKPVFQDMGFNFWVNETALGGRGQTYLVSCDPATGSGKDFSVIEVFDFPNLNQIAEYRTNDVNIPMLYAKLKWILNKLSVSNARGRAEVIWTFERNGIGEALSALYQNDERQPEHAELYCDVPGKFGIFTSGKTKILGCLQLKQLIEKINNGLKVNSQHLLFELKNFVAKGGSYEAKSGAADDTVMATVGIVRLLKRLSEWNDTAFNQVNEYVDPDDSSDDQFGDAPVPFVV